MGPMVTRLTDEQIMALNDANPAMFDFARAIEAAVLTANPQPSPDAQDVLRYLESQAQRMEDSDPIPLHGHAKRMRDAAALIRAQAERIASLEFSERAEHAAHTSYKERAERAEQQFTSLREATRTEWADLWERTRKAEAERERLTAELAEAQKDAERYRFLREFKRPADYYSGEDTWSVSRERSGYGECYRGQNLDAHIDAATKDQPAAADAATREGAVGAMPERTSAEADPRMIGQESEQDAKRRMAEEIARKRPAAADPSPEPRADEDDLPGMLAVAKGVAEQRWPHTMDAAVWAKEFMDRYLGVGHDPSMRIDEGTMIGWFANAIMAGYDTAQMRAAKPEPLAKVQAERDAALALLRQAQELWRASGSLTADDVQTNVESFLARRSARHERA